ncbi:MerC domain-containing protein [Candidatus Gottesmanbacteria bacterium]|nr:MerC domain-containing protein [Candidatus Gottesmanbacteria bacterium]
MKGNKEHLTGVPAILAIVLGVLCPLCFIAPLLFAAGFGSVLVVAVPWLKPLLVVVIIAALMGLGISFKVHRNFLPIVLTLIAGGLMYYGNYISYNPNMTYLGGFLIIVAISSDWWLRKKCNCCEDCKIDTHKNK